MWCLIGTMAPYIGLFSVWGSPHIDFISNGKIKFFCLICPHFVPACIEHHNLFTPDDTLLFNRSIGRRNVPHLLKNLSY
jgi:hypothetical protein